MTQRSTLLMPEDEKTNRYLNLVRFAMGEPPEKFLWRQDEAAMLWQWLLGQPFSQCLDELSPFEVVRYTKLCASSNPPISTIQDLLLHEQPKVNLLRTLSAWCQRSLQDPTGMMPHEIAKALFNVAVILARVVCGTRIVDLDDVTLAERAKCIEDLSWIDPKTKCVLRRATQVLNPQRGTEQ
jgi:hypothetical protein